MRYLAYGIKPETLILHCGNIRLKEKLNIQYKDFSIKWILSNDQAAAHIYSLLCEVLVAVFL